MIQRLLFKCTGSTPGLLALLSASCRPHRKQPPAADTLASPVRQWRASKKQLQSLFKKTQGFPLDQAGQGLTEYLVLLLLIAVISIGAARTLGRTIQGKLQMAERHIEDVQLDKRD